jgi:hypothetical protein
LSNADWFRPRCEEHQKKREGDSRKRKRETWSLSEAAAAADEVSSAVSMKRNEQLLRTDKVTIYPTSILYACPYMDVLCNKYITKTMSICCQCQFISIMTKMNDLWPQYTQMTLT